MLSRSDFGHYSATGIVVWKHSREGREFFSSLGKYRCVREFGRDMKYDSDFKKAFFFKLLLCYPELTSGIFQQLE